jgi:hypothetical protein
MHPRTSRCFEPLVHADRTRLRGKNRSGLPPSRSQGFFRAPRNPNRYLTRSGL